MSMRVSARNRSSSRSTASCWTRSGLIRRNGRSWRSSSSSLTTSIAFPASSITKSRSSATVRRIGNGSKARAPIDTADLKSLLNTLATLRAVRWVGATTPAHGFDKPQLVVTFTTSPDEKALHKLTIGNRTDDGMWFAKADGRDGTFVVSNPDLTALKLPLTKSAASSPSPSATPSPAVTGSPVATP